jgi:anti-anti-sigma factor
MDFDESLGRYNTMHVSAPIGRRFSDSGDLVLGLSGDLEMKTSTDIAPVIESALLECPMRGRFVLDLSKVGYVSSTGVGLLANTMVSAEKRSVTLVLLDITPRVRSVMDALGLLFFFTLEESNG